MIDRCTKILKLEQPNLEERFRFFQDYIFENDIDCEDISLAKFSKLSTNKYSLRDTKFLIDDARSIVRSSAWKAKHFREIKSVDNIPKYIACNCLNMSCGGFEANIRDIHKQVRLPKILFKHLEIANSTRVPSTTSEDTNKINNWYKHRNVNGDIKNKNKNNNNDNTEVSVTNPSNIDDNFLCMILIVLFFIAFIVCICLLSYYDIIIF